MAALGIENRVKENPCIWMQAGVIPQKRCKSEYDCVACRFDKAMQRLAAENEKARKTGTAAKTNRDRISSWKVRLLELPPWKRPCLHHLKNRIDFRACTNAYRCDNCDFDQYFYDEYSVHAIVKPVDVLNVDGFKIPQGYYLHRGHAWIKIEERAEVRIGLDDFALRLFGLPDRVDSPLVGKEVRQDRADFKMKRGPNIAKILSPVNGVITAVNPKPRGEGSRLSADSYAEGWIARVHCETLRQDLKSLMIGNETADFLHEEVDRLQNVIEQQIGPMAADGGEFGKDIYGALPAIGWERLARLFLRTQ